MDKEDGLFTYEEVSKLAKRLEEETIETRCELAKYKRAFEILKDRLMLKIYEEEYHYKQLYTLESSKEVRIEQEEYELLEELMKSEIYG